MSKKTFVLPVALLALCACLHSQAADKKYDKQVVSMACGEANYTLSSVCSKSGDPMELNDCKPQSLIIEHAGAKRTAALPELPKDESKRLRAGGRNLQDLFVVRWACSAARSGPIVTLYYSIGGGSAPDGETWTHYDKTGKLMESSTKLTPDEVKAIERNFKKVPSIMPD